MNKRDVTSQQTPRVRESLLEEPAGERLVQRLHAYLSALALPESLIEDWVSRACEGEVEAKLAFTRLQAMMADYWRQHSGEHALDDQSAVAKFRLCGWLMSGTSVEAPDCQRHLDALLAALPITRQSMVPESWDR